MAPVEGRQSLLAAGGLEYARCGSWNHSVDSGVACYISPGILLSYGNAPYSTSFVELEPRQTELLLGLVVTGGEINLYPMHLGIINWPFGLGMIRAQGARGPGINSQNGPCCPIHSPISPYCLSSRKAIPTTIG